MKKKDIQPKTKNYSVPTTEEMKMKLEEVRDELDYDVNEMTRRYWEKLIDDAYKSRTAS